MEAKPVEQNNPAKTYQFWCDALEDFDYNEKEALIEMHILPEDYEKMDYYRLNEILKAKSRQDRPQDLFSVMKGMK